MLCEFNFRAAPRIVLLPVAAIVLTAGSIVVIVLVHIVAGIIALAVAGWLSYHLVRFTVRHLGSHMRTSDEGLVSVTSFGSESRIAWERLTHAGCYVTGKSERYLFAYNEQDDELITIPPYYTYLDELESEFRDHTGTFLVLSGADPDGLADSLRPYLDG